MVLYNAVSFSIVEITSRKGVTGEEQLSTCELAEPAGQHFFVEDQFVGVDGGSSLFCGR